MLLHCNKLYCTVHWFKISGFGKLQQKISTVGQQCCEPKWNPPVLQWHIDTVTKWHSDKVTKWQSDTVTKWQSDKVTKWQSDKVKQWHWRSVMSLRLMLKLHCNISTCYDLHSSTLHKQCYAVLQCTGHWRFVSHAEAPNIQTCLLFRWLPLTVHHW